MFGCYNLCMQHEPQSQAPFDRRQAPRIDVEGRYSVRIDPLDGREPITCAIQDFSVTGLRLELPDDMEMPRDVHVVIGTISHNCRIVWRTGSTIGVDFVDEHHSIF